MLDTRHGIFLVFSRVRRSRRSRGAAPTSRGWLSSGLGCAFHGYCVLPAVHFSLSWEGMWAQPSPQENSFSWHVEHDWRSQHWDIRYHEWELCSFIGTESRHYLYCSIFSTRLFNLNTETVHHFNIFVLFTPCFQALCQALRTHLLHLGQDVAWPGSLLPIIGISPHSYKALFCEAFKHSLEYVGVLSLWW